MIKMLIQLLLTMIVQFLQVDQRIILYNFEKLKHNNKL